MRFFAGIQGIDLDKASRKASRNMEQEQEQERDDLLFDDPKKYENMSHEDRKIKTEKMLQKFKNWAGQSPLGVN